MSEQRRETYLTDKEVEMPYCPGCGHTSLVRALDKALVKLQPDPAKVVIVTDIGCIGLADRSFATNAFHGLHGRAITYACGLKLARPELEVIAFMGDGACGIGGTHLLNVARRNIGITLLVANNLNYGMTGGQHSVTTPVAGITASTPWGNVEQPLNICATAVAAGASWVHRATTFDPDLDDVIAEAISEPGFSMVEAWELCTAYYMPRNDFKKKDMQALVGQFGFELGRVACAPRAEYTSSQRQAVARSAYTAKPRKLIEVTHENAVGQQVGVLLAGSAGQKVKSSATLFAQAAIASGLHATQKDDYPITIMTGHSLSELIFSPTSIDYSGLETPQHVVVVSQDGLMRARSRISTLPATSVLYIEESLDVPDTLARVYRYPFEKTAKKLNRFAVSIVALGALLEHSQLFPLAAIEAASASFQSEPVARINAAALVAGASLVTQ